MVDKLNTELDEAFLKKFFGLTERVIPEDQEITPAMLRRQLDEIETTLNEAKLEAKEKAAVAASVNEQLSRQPAGPPPMFGDNPDEDVFNLPKKTILIIDDLGVITYQLSVLFKQYNFDVITSKEIYDAIEKFKKQSFDIVVMDLYIPTEREGFILLEELKKIALSKQKVIKIGVMSASAKKEHKQLCKMKGAEFYLEKIDDWQKELFKLIKDA
ncbi:MAG: response regulator [Candidatus Gastranaerophilales bacterium]|nr:response regulator [Candidatus Gastranaerophilales bacterium]